MKFPYGNCECDKGIGSGCCHGRGPAAFEVTRDGKPVRLCTRCDLSSDRPTRRLLVTRADSVELIELFMEFDFLGGLYIAAELDAFAPKAGR